jgi:hypothetical protein
MDELNLKVTEWIALGLAGKSLEARAKNNGRGWYVEFGVPYENGYCSIGFRDDEERARAFAELHNRRREHLNG